MRVRLIVNPRSSGTDDALVARVVGTLAATCEVELATTRAAGHATELAARPGVDAVVAMGGDGTYNEVVNGLPAGVALGLLPAGATSVFARQLGWPKNVLRTAAGLAQSIPAGASRRIGLGRMNDRRFTFSAGFGLDAEAMRLVHEDRAGHHDLRRPNDIKVVGAALRALRADGWSLPDRATLQDGTDELRCSYVAIANGNPYTYLGPVGVRATPRASFDSGLDVVAAGNLRSRDLWRLGVYGLVWPRHASGRDRRVAYLHDRSALTLVADSTVSAQLDGEYVGRLEKAEIVYEADAVTVYVPTAPTREPASAAAGT
jgi:diacylglycerol kinase family enzyme